MAKLAAVVVGFGHLGNFHAQKYKSLEDEGVELVGLVDANLEQAKVKAAKNFPGVPVFASVAELLATADAGKIQRPQVASVATTTEHHLSVSLDLMAAGVHLLVEKPLAFTTAQGKQLVDYAQKAKLVLATGQVERHRAVEAFEELKGRPHFIECHRLSPFPARSTDIDVILDLMIHDIDLMLAMVKSPIKSIHAAGFSVLTSQFDIANARFEFENGCVANLTSSRISITRTRKFRVFCSDAYLSMDLGAGSFEIYHKDPAEKDLAKAITHKSGSLSVEDALREEIRDFVGAVREKRPPLVSGADGLRALEVAELVIRDVKQRLSAVK